MPFPKGKHLTKEHREKISRAMSRLMKSPSSKKKISDSLKKYYKTHPDAAKIMREKVDRAVTRWWKEHPEARRKSSLKIRLLYRKNPAIKKKIDKSLTRWWKEHPAAKKEMGQKITDFFIHNPKAFQEFLKHGKNPLKPHLKTPQGFKVRSKGEQEIANFLHEKNIACQYESISLPITTPPYAGNICTPDFWLPNWNIFIEFYGGYPAAWKKKVLKNKIYKSHRIPVLAITPSELEDLDYYLLRQGKKMSKTKVAREFRIGKLSS